MQNCPVHVTMVIGEVDQGDYVVCAECGGKTMLISAPSCWYADPEPFKEGEAVAEREDVEVAEEITAHHCQNCYRITSLSFNQD